MKGHLITRDDLERYGRVWGSGPERRALCPFCGDEHKRDRAHASLAFNVDSGAWECHRCERRGLLAEYWSKRPGDDPLRPRRRAAPRSAPQSREPSAAEMDEDARKRARLRRLWKDTLPLADPLAVGACTYLAGRGIPAEVAAAARVRYSPSWGTAGTYIGPAVVFPVQDAAGKLVAAEGRFMTPPGDVAKTHSAGAKSLGVFEALPSALAADGVTLCEGPITALSVAACGFPALALCGHVVRPWLVRRLALRDVFVSLDWHEDKAEENGAAACCALAALGARPYRLAPPAGNDWNEYLQARGLDPMRAELDAAICGALTR
jgi:Toprim domain